jgi:hypothetical protein
LRQKVNAGQRQGKARQQLKGRERKSSDTQKREKKEGAVVRLREKKV